MTVYTAGYPSGYFGADPEIDVEQKVSVDDGATWVDTDTSPVPNCPAGTNPQFLIKVTSTGIVRLSGVQVNSYLDLDSIPPPTTLDTGQSFECTVPGTWAAGLRVILTRAAGGFTDDSGHSIGPAGWDWTMYIGVSDATPPAITITAPVDGTQYTLGQAVTADWSVDDTDSGVASSSGTAAESAHWHVHAGGEDLHRHGHGRCGEQQHGDTALHRGIRVHPVTPSSSKATQMKLGSGMTIRNALKDAAGALVTNAAVQLYAAPQKGSGWGTEVAASSLTGPKTSNTCRYDPDKGQYVYNLDTSKLGIGTWQLRAKLDDGTVQTMTIKITKRGPGFMPGLSFMRARPTPRSRRWAGRRSGTTRTPSPCRRWPGRARP
jgi:hypothetical protein